MGIVDKMNELVDSIKGFFEQISTVFGFWLDDPFGFTAEKLKEACLGFATKILPVFTEALKPDLSADWVVSSYRISFAVAVMILRLVVDLDARSRGDEPCGTQRCARQLPCPSTSVRHRQRVRAAFGVAADAVLRKTL